MASLSEVVGESSTARLTPLLASTSDLSKAELPIPSVARSLPTSSGIDIPLTSMESIFDIPESSTSTGLTSIDEEACRPHSVATKKERKYFLKLEKLRDLLSSLWKCIYDPNAPTPSDEDIRLGYNQLQHRNYFKYPQGWPQLAAAFDNPDQGAFRIFGQVHTRLLFELGAQISDLEKKLFNADLKDYRQNPDSLRSLQGLEQESEEKKELKWKLSALTREYGTLFLNLNQLRQLCPAPDWKIKNMWNYLHGKDGPLNDGEYDRMCEADDMACPNGDFKPSTQSSKIDDLLEKHLILSPDSWWTRLLGTDAPEGATDKTRFFDREKLKTLAKISGLILVVLILLVPNFLLWLQPMNAAGTTSVFTVAVIVFVILMSGLTYAKVESIMIGACGYCAVLVTILVVTRGGTN
ncbi:hypothetical protein B7463_g4268, partial [Scytalidium lignicola]